MLLFVVIDRLVSLLPLWKWVE